MNWLLVIPISLLTLLFLLIFTTIKIKLQYNHLGIDDHFNVRFSAWFGLLHYTIDVPFIDIEEDMDAVDFTQTKGVNIEEKEVKAREVTASDLVKNLKDIKDLLQQIVGLHLIVRKLLGKTKVQQFNWHSLIGSGDAAHTGLLAGMGWAVKGSVIGLLTSYLDFRVMPVYSIQPDFQKSIVSTSISCIVHLRLGDAIWAGIKLFRHWKGGRLKIISRANKQNF